MQAAEPYAAADRWLLDLDLDGFAREIEALGRRLRSEQGDEDVEHLRGVVMASDVCAFIGLATMWMEPNVLTVLAICLWSHSRFTMLGHHIGHGTYNRLDRSRVYDNRTFALGGLWKRAVDWFDWVLPEAWLVCHNHWHHYRLGEVADPDNIAQATRSWKNKEGMFIVALHTWKWAFGGPNTYKVWKLSSLRKQGRRLPPGTVDQHEPMSLNQAVKLDREGGGIFQLQEYLDRVMIPYILRFLIIPLPLAVFGPHFYLHGLSNLVLGDVLAQIQDFIIITPQHAGGDLYRFEHGCKPNSPTFYLRAVISTANCCTGGDVNDFLHGYGNYQIEHHLWPDLSMLSMRKAQPQVKAICKKYGIPYVQEPVFMRFKKAFDIATCRERMRSFPVELERKADFMDWKDDRVVAV